MPLVSATRLILTPIFARLDATLWQIWPSFT
ncbi:Uncharacterised protein [Mycobacterium tuberculosis]|nr:Uncharacterised protein [Mycobacterium tuberculosis]